MRRYVSPRLLIPCSITLPPEPVCFGTRPAHAANSRPELNAFGSPIIATAAVRNLLGGEQAISRSRTPAIVADAAHVILTSNSREFTGRHCIDEEVLLAAGVTDFDGYRSVAGSGALAPDLFVDAPVPPAPGGV